MVLHIGEKTILKGYSMNPISLFNHRSRTNLGSKLWSGWEIPFNNCTLLFHQPTTIYTYNKSAQPCIALLKWWDDKKKICLLGQTKSTVHVRRQIFTSVNKMCSHASCTLNSEGTLVMWFLWKVDVAKWPFQNEKSVLKRKQEHQDESYRNNGPLVRLVSALSSYTVQSITETRSAANALPRGGGTILISHLTVTLIMNSYSGYKECPDALCAMRRGSITDVLRIITMTALSTVNYWEYQLLHSGYL